MANKRNSKTSLWVIDVLGALTVAACGGGVVWLLAVQADQTATERNESTQMIETARNDLNTLRAACAQQRQVLADREAERTGSGHLPEQTPIEAYFQALSDLAGRHKLRVVRHNPLTAQQYPGILEQRYEYEVIGATKDLMGFLKAVEETQFWADISFLQIEDSQKGAQQRAAERVATLTFSLFSALPTNLPGATG